MQRNSSHFNPRSRGGSDHRCELIQNEEHHFNPRSRGGSDGLICEVMKVSIYFNPRSRGGSDLQQGGLCHGGKISIHAPAEGATPDFVPTRRWAKFQSTLPRRERLLRGERHKEGKGISIHAPAEGATKRCIITMRYYDISIHAPAEGATRSRRSF